MISCRNFDLSGSNTFRIPAVAACYVEYSSVAELERVVKSKRYPRPFLHLGRGSNVLFTSGNFPGTVLHSRLDKVELFEGTRGKVLARVGAAKCLDEFIAQMCEEGLWGLENLSGIPGEVGAGVVGNVGAYGVEISSCIERIYCFDTVELKQVVLKPADCAYGYRYSIFKSTGVLERRYVVLFVDFVLSRSATPKLDYGDIRGKIEATLGCASGAVVRDRKKISSKLVREVVLSTRGAKLPAVEEYGSAGSFFKNPVIGADEFATLCDILGPQVPHYDLPNGLVKVPAAFLIEKAGFKGIVKGNVGSWPTQPLVLYNVTGRASAEEVVAFAREIITVIKEKFNITLHTEVEYVQFYS